ncbi:MAG: hypothetical protein NT144_13235 [Bacteroidia bacterium]|nr:hypothetical protein [Bacteroidia bacterium]
MNIRQNTYRKTLGAITRADIPEKVEELKKILEKYQKQSHTTKI